jgi:hypothetical protein
LRSAPLNQDHNGPGYHDGAQRQQHEGGVFHW